jgi:hypothetical protein
MPKHKPSASDDNDLRAFYEACGLSQQTIEGAIRQRYEEPTISPAAREPVKRPGLRMSVGVVAV